MELVKIKELKGMEFEVVESIPKGYVILNTNIDSEYLPLCILDKNCYVDKSTLKCIKLRSKEDVHDIYNGMCYVRNATPKALMTYFKKYNKDGLSAKMEYRLNHVYKALRALQRNEINF